MKKILSAAVLATTTLALVPASLPASASQIISIGADTITFDNGPYSYDGGDGSFSDPWQIGFSGASANFEVVFNGLTVSTCAEDPTDKPNFTVGTFNSGDSSCSFVMDSAADAKFRVAITFSGGGTAFYFIKTGSLSGGGSGGSGDSGASAQPTPAKYSGPEFSSLSLKPVMHGTSTTLTGKRLTQVSSIEIGGKAATFTATSDTELSLTPAADLAPGTYDLVINSAAGKLTHMNAVRIQPALRSFSVTTRAENRIIEEQYQEHSLIASIQQSELTKARCIVNGPNLAQAKAQAERLCALVKAANPNIETTVIDPRSTVKNNTVFARVTYGWN
jgi:hypothetical protein